MEDLQSLLEKINRDGIEKAEKEAAKIISDAKSKADLIIKEAREEAGKLESESRENAKGFAERAEETIKQAARDTILQVEASVTALLEKLLLKKVETSMADSATLQDLVKEAVKSAVGGGEIVCNGKLAAALTDALKELPEFTVSMDETFGSGFSVRLDDGRVESSFSAEMIAAELAKRLRPDLAKLVSAGK